MLGLLGGLLGRGLARSFVARPLAGRPLAGLIANRALRNAVSPGRGGGGMASGPAPMQSPQQDAAPAEATVAEQAQPQELAPMAAPQDSPAVQTAKAGGKVTDSLLEAPPPVERPQPQADDKVAPPAQIANKTETSAPVAQVEGQQYPAVPETPLSGLADRIGDMPEPRNAVFEDPVPLKPADVKSQARHTASRPDMSFGLASTSTAYSPSYYFRGR